MSLIYLAASGDLRPSANQVCWPAQQELEALLTRAVQGFGHELRRAHPINAAEGHGFINSQRYGMDVFRDLPPNAPVIVAEAVWQYSHHVLAGLLHHKGPILTAANWSGQWPGLVGLLNLNACLTKAGVAYSTLWSEDFTDEYALSRLERWLSGERIEHDSSHVQAFDVDVVSSRAAEVGSKIAARLLREKAILGIFDEGCMGMYNAIIPEELLHPMGIFKERLSQSALFAAMRLVGEEEARSVLDWLRARGMQFKTGTDGATELTEAQLLDQCRMYIAALRIADQFGCASIGISISRD